ncbi:MAG TPA: MarR family transcriptional regulator [Xanthobacteraceae bacterium]|nr:MarR family transcriptional regulator [Xanthobacteraceae bacterium]
MAVSAPKEDWFAPAARRHRAGRASRPGYPRSRRAVELGALNAHLGYFIRRLQVWIFQDIIRSLKSLDMSPAQYSVLLVIGANPGLSQTALAGTLGIERARLVRLLHKLERRGLMRRQQSSADGRTNALRLTAKGQDALRRAQALAAEHEARLMQRLGTEPYRIMRDLLRDFVINDGMG